MLDIPSEPAVPGSVPESPEPPPTQPSEAASPVGRDQVKEIEAILNRLLPEDGRVTFLDRYGRTYGSPLYATIRMQKRLLGYLRAFFAVETDAALQRPQHIVGELLRTMTSDAGVDELVGVFEELHRDALLQCRADAVAQGDAQHDTPIEDLLAIEEVARAVLPFCARPLARTIETLQPVLQALGLSN